MIATSYAVECDRCPDWFGFSCATKAKAIRKAVDGGWKVNARTGAATCPHCLDELAKPELYKDRPKRKLRES